LNNEYRLTIFDFKFNIVRNLIPVISYLLYFVIFLKQLLKLEI